MKKSKIDPALDPLINRMTEAGIVAPPSHDFSSWYLTKTGEGKLEAGGLVFPEDGRMRMDFLKSVIQNGILSPEDVHMKLLALPEVIGIPGLREDVAKSMAAMIKDSGADFDRLCSIAYAGVGTGDLIASELGVPHAIFRKNQEARHKPTVGAINDGDRVALHDDVLYQGDAMVTTAGKLRQANNAKVDTGFVFLDRSAEGGGQDRCKKWGIDVHSQMDVERLKHSMLKNPNLSEEAKELLRLHQNKPLSR